MVMAISPLPGHELFHWSLLDFVPQNVQTWNSNLGDRPTYFVQSAFGSGSMNFSLDIQVGRSTFDDSTTQLKQFFFID